MFKLMFRRGRKEATRAAPGERVMELSSRGFSEPEIIGSLRKEGYSPSEVDSAMKEALKTGAGGPGRGPRFPAREAREEPLPGEPFPGERPSRLQEPEEEMEEETEEPAGRREMPGSLRPEEVEGVPRLPEIPGEERLAPAEPVEELEEEEVPLRAPRRPAFGPEREIPRLPPRMPPGGSLRDRRIAELRERRRREMMELTEELVEEKWAEVEDRLKDIEGKFKELGAKISGLEERMSKMKWEKSDEVKTIKDNIDSYRDTLVEMNSRMEGMEKAVRSSLSPMMESMRSLSDTIKVLKKGRKVMEKEGENE